MLAAEWIAFNDLVDASYTLSMEVEKILGNIKVPVQLLARSNYLFDRSRKGIPTTEKQLMLETDWAREGYHTLDICEIGFVCSRDNVADGLAKKMRQGSLLEMLTTYKLEVKPEQ